LTQKVQCACLGKDPHVAHLEKEVNVAKEAANRWTDNIFTLQSYCSNNYNIARSDFYTQFGLPEDLDYVE
jgi:hypothetical protein